MFSFRFIQSDRAVKLLLIPALTAGVALAQGLALSPMRTEINVVAGTQRNGALTIANDAKENSRFRVEILDVSIDREATPQFEKEIISESEFSCRQWITVNPMEAEMGAGTQMPVRYTFRVSPDTPTGTYHCALGFTAMSDARGPQAGMGIVAQVRLAATFYLTVGKPDAAGEIREMEIEKMRADDSSGYRAVISVLNSGLTNLRGAGKVEVLTETGEVREILEFPPVVIFPKRTQRLPVVLRRKLPEGTYTLRTRVNLGTGEIQEATLRFHVSAE
jgi:hypothetical protein